MRTLALVTVATGCFFEPPRPLDSDAQPGDAVAGDLGTNYVFVTSMTYTPAMLGGIDGADAACNAAAATHLPGSYRAWLSTSTLDAVRRFDGVRGWQRPDHQPVADLPTELTTRILYPPRIDEMGHPVADDALVITGTNTGGRGVPGESCNDYTPSAPGSQYLFGHPDGGGGVWTAGGYVDCTTAGHLYCFGTDRATPLPSLTPAHPNAFVTLNNYYFAAGSTIADADQFCQNAAGLGGHYRALLATSAAPASARFAGTIGPWYRNDGVAFARTDLSRFDAPLVMTETNVQIDTDVFVGAAGPGSPAMASCTDWSQPTLMTTTGDSARATSTAFTGYSTSFSCGGGAHLYCLEYTP